MQLKAAALLWTAHKSRMRSRVSERRRSAMELLRRRAVAARRSHGRRTGPLATLRRVARHVHRRVIAMRTHPVARVRGRLTVRVLRKRARWISVRAARRRAVAQVGDAMHGRLLLQRRKRAQR